MAVIADQRRAIAVAAPLLTVSVVLLLADAGVLELSSAWYKPILCVVGAVGLFGVAEAQSKAAYAGVLSRLSEQHGWSVWPLRTVTLLTAAMAGVGVAAYAGIALMQVVREPAGRDLGIDWRQCVATALLGLGIVLMLLELGLVVGSGELLWTVLLAGSGLSLFWWLPEGARLSGTAAEQDVTLRFHLSLLLMVGSVVYAIDILSDAARNGTAAWPTVVATGVVIVIPLLAIGPRWLRTLRALSRERIELARANARTELAGRVHDEVMQTLALIQDRADEPSEVRRLARRQERDLRSWLITREPAAAPTRSLATALRTAAAEVEDAHGVAIDVVTVGDAPLDHDSEALVLAAREALVNAAKYAGDTSISLFGEIESGQVSVYVRDRGPGFDLNDIPADRHGVRESIVARMARHGGRATIRTAPGGGSEIRLTQER